VDLAEVARARVEIRHVRGASDATYLINAFGEELMQLPCGTSLPVSCHAKRSMPHSRRLQPWRTPRPRQRRLA
jgi:hypothetical protein